MAVAAILDSEDKEMGGMYKGLDQFVKTIEVVFARFFGRSPAFTSSDMSEMPGRQVSLSILGGYK